MGPYKNSLGKTCGGEWQRTPASTLSNYLKNSSVWVCPKKQRGLTYKTEPGSYNPTITGFLSYGFNYLGVFGGDSGRSFKASSIQRPTDVVAVTEVNGTNDPRKIGEALAMKKADAALAGWILGRRVVSRRDRSQGKSGTSDFQSQMKKHLKRVNIVYVDGHSAGSRPSQLIWGQFYGVFSGNSIPNSSKRWDRPVSNEALDAAEIKPD